MSSQLTGEFWAGTSEKFVQLRSEGQLLDGELPTMEKGVHWPDVFVQVITQDADGRVWFASNQNGLFGMDGDLRTMAKGQANWVNLTKDDGLTDVEPGDSITYTIEVSNTGNQDAI